MKAEWRKAAAFAEFAEALAIDTTDILAAWSVIDHGEATGALAVLYGRDVVREARLQRDHYGILRLVGKPEDTDLRPEDMFR